MASAPVNMPLYRVLLRMGASEDEAEAAATSDTAHLVTITDLLELETRWQKFLATTLLGMTGVWILVAILTDLIRIGRG